MGLSLGAERRDTEEVLIGFPYGMHINRFTKGGRCHELELRALLLLLQVSPIPWAPLGLAYAC